MTREAVLERHPGIMDQTSVRSLTSQLADDLAWLEEHARRQPEQAVHAGALRLASGLVRNVIAPFLEGFAPEPLHVAVVGGAGAGKSTVANLLCGASHAEANPQAGFTRHPVAYASAFGTLSWPAGLGFLGSLRRLSAQEPSSLDADVYQVRRIHYEPEQFSVLDRYVVWDCPDMTTWASAGYTMRLLEVAALADVIVYVASDERYNDEVPTQFLRMLLEAGKAVVVCLVKMRETNGPAFIAHFKKDVLGRMPAAPVAVLAIPHLTHEQLADPVHNAARYRIPLVNQVNVLGEPINLARRRTVQHAIHFLQSQHLRLLGVAQADLVALEGWRNAVQEGQVEFDARYRREYLTGANFRRFDEALLRLLDMLELPGVGRFVSGTMYVLRTPYRLLKSLFVKALTRPEAAALPERPVLEAAFAGWIDLLRKEAARRDETHPVWRHLNKGFTNGGLADTAHDQFEQSFRAFQLSLTDEVERTARGLYEDLEKNPVALNTLRGTKFTLEMASITATVITVGHNLVFDVVLVPLAASVTHQLVELLGKQYVDYHRETARNRQQAMVTQYVSGPMAEWLIRWPTSGGSEYERLQLILRRFPPALAQTETLIDLAMQS
jgi:50S ribosome-binding GTPase